MVKIFLLIAMITPDVVPSVRSIEMTSLKQCAEIREALFSRGRILMCVESVVPQPEKRARHEAKK
tara:strand:+ start:318 stop:512 length:195 start_codon:yes stop_codon:yes gene_type:complete